MNEQILLVDDDAGVRDVVAFTLRREGFEVDEERDGPGALESGRSGRYALVILDVMLPGMSGVEVCRALRAESDVPILMLTARDAEADRVLGLELGADDYVTKPFSSAELLSRVRAILRRRELDRAGGKRDGARARRPEDRPRPPRSARRRRARPPDAVGVQGALAPGRAAGGGHLPPRAHAAPVGERVRRRRARVRGAHLEPAAEDRARPEPAGAPRDVAGRGTSSSRPDSEAHPGADEHLAAGAGGRGLARRRPRVARRGDAVGGCIARDNPFGAGGARRAAVRGQPVRAAVLAGRVVRGRTGGTAAGLLLHVRRARPRPVPRARDRRARDGDDRRGVGRPRRRRDRRAGSGGGGHRGSFLGDELVPLAELAPRASATSRSSQPAGSDTRGRPRRARARRRGRAGRHRVPLHSASATSRGSISRRCARTSDRDRRVHGPRGAHGADARHRRAARRPSASPLPRAARRLGQLGRSTSAASARRGRGRYPPQSSSATCSRRSAHAAFERSAPSSVEADTSGMRDDDRPPTGLVAARRWFPRRRAPRTRTTPTGSASSARNWTTRRAD